MWVQVRGLFSHRLPRHLSGAPKHSRFQTMARGPVWGWCGGRVWDFAYGTRMARNTTFPTFPQSFNNITCILFHCSCWIIYGSCSAICQVNNTSKLLIWPECKEFKSLCVHVKCSRPYPLYSHHWCQHRWPTFHLNLREETPLEAVVNHDILGRASAHCSCMGLNSWNI